jgi:hypothetical protein
MTTPFAEMGLHIRALQLSQMLHVAAELGLADRIGDAPRPVAELAGECGAHPRMLPRLIRALAAFDIFTIDVDGHVAHTPKSRCLRRDATPTVHYAARYWGLPNTWATWGQFEHTVRTGEPAFEHVYGMPNFDYLAAHPDESQVFDEFMQHSPDDRHRAVANAYPFEGTVVDIGGGSGGLLQAVLGKHPKARGILYDQPKVVAGAGAVLGALSERCTIVGGSFFEGAPEGGDIYTMSQIIHDWNDARCLQILGHCRRAMRPEARLLIIERLVEEPPEPTQPAILLGDLHMGVLFPGAQERTAGEIGQLLTTSGFGPYRVIRTTSPFAIIETRPA